jgi:hypothetical protein
MVDVGIAADRQCDANGGPVAHFTENLRITRCGSRPETTRDTRLWTNRRAWAGSSVCGFGALRGLGRRNPAHATARAAHATDRLTPPRLLLTGNAHPGAFPSRRSLPIGIWHMNCFA